MTEKLNILVADDERAFRENLVEYLTLKGFHVIEARDGKEAVDKAENNFIHLALLDIHMPRLDGLNVLSKLKELDPLTEVVIITGEGSVDTAVVAMTKGAFHYITKPVRMKELEMLVVRGLEKAKLARKNQRHQEKVKHTNFADEKSIIAESDEMKDLLKKCRQVAMTDMPVLILGETGTGKEVLADFIHISSDRNQEEQVNVNCGTLTENLMDAELFGYEKGAFTGANEKRMGMIEVADGGTLFLDEIGDIPAPAQVRLLRFLEQGVVRSLGSSRERAVDTRVVAATHKNLQEEVEKGNFREDLYHRLNAYPLVIPPLRQRKKDIIPLYEHMIAKLRTKGIECDFSEEAKSQLLAYHWPGNVRELQHTVERAALNALVAESRMVRPEHLMIVKSPVQNNVITTLREAEVMHVDRVLSHFNGNRKKTAEILGISERHLYRLIRQSKDGDPVSQ